MATNQIMTGVSFDPEVYQELEKIRGGRQRVRSAYINQVLREKLGLPVKDTPRQKPRAV